MPRYRRSEFEFGLFVAFVSVLLRACPVATTQSYPCAFANTVNVSDGLRLKDGSYSYEGLVIPAIMTAEYNFKVIDGVEYSASKHPRGCACLQKPCITFCCPPEQMFDEEQHVCVPLVTTTGSQHTQHAHVEVTSQNGSVNAVNIRNSFVLRFELGCSKKYIDKNNEDFWKWDLYQNGTLWSNGRLWSTDEYCFTPLQHKNVWSLVPLTCEHSQRGFRLWIYVICMVLAILTNLFILLLLVSIKDVRNGGYGESVIFYLASTIIGLSALLYLALKSRLSLSETACRNLGFLGYFFLILSFLLLDLISWNFWYNFCSKRLGGWKRKLLYGVAIALAFAFKFLVRFAQDSNMAQKFKPGIGETFCWFDMRLWGILLYFYIPTLVCLGLGAAFCAKAYFVIWHLPTDTLNVAGYDLDLHKSHFNAFCAYFLGVISVWMREIIVYTTALVRGHYFIIDFWTGICMLGLAIHGFIFLVYKDKLVQSWWRINVSNQPNVDDIYMARIYPSDYTRTEKLKEGYKKDIQDEDIALR